MKRYVLSIVLALCILTSAAVLYAAGPGSFAPIVKKAAPAVVNIYTETKVKASQFINPFEDFLGSLPPQIRDRFNDYINIFPSPNKDTTRTALGSGFIISQDGYIVTNAHVIAKADVIKVVFQGENQNDGILAKVIGKDEETDLALLKVDAGRVLPVLSFGNSDSLEVGDWVLAIGNPFGFQHTVTAGIISAKNRSIDVGIFANYLQTDVPINGGNSGGPLINTKGEVVGVNTAILNNTQGIGFAIASNVVTQVVDGLKKYGKVVRGWLGVSVQPLTQDTVKALNLQSTRGVIVNAVVKNGPAYTAGLRIGDIITAVDTNNITGIEDFLQRIGSYPPNTTVKLLYVRKGQQRTAIVRLGQRTTENLKAERYVDSGTTSESQSAKNTVLNIDVVALTEDVYNSYGIPKSVQGLVITKLYNDSPLQQMGVRQGDVILSVNMEKVTTIPMLNSILAKSKSNGAVLLQLFRKNTTFFVSVPIQ